RGAVLLEDSLLALEVFDRSAEPVSDVTVLGEDVEGALLATAADQDLRAALLDRSRHVERAVDAVELALERRPLFGKQQLGDGHRLRKPVHAPGDRRVIEAVADMLVLVPRRADAEDGATLGDDVEGGDLLGDQRRVAIGDAR